MVKEVTRHDVRRLMDEGAQIVDVLPRSEYEDSHLPGAINIPLGRLPAEAPSRLDRDRPVVTYCYDSLCDMSPRGAWRLVELGFADVHDYVASKVDWIGAGLPFDGARAKRPHLASLADRSVPTCRMAERLADVRPRVGDWDICLVVNDGDVVLGLVRTEAFDLEADRAVSDVVREAPQTFRPHMTADEMLPSLRKASEPWVLVTNLNGTLVGVARPDQVHAAAHGDHEHG